MVVATYAATVAAAITLAIRSRAWRAPNEFGATLAVGLLGIGTWLMSDHCKIGEFVRAATGFVHLDTFAGHLCWIAGLVSLLQHVFARITYADELAAVFDDFIRRPITLASAIMLCALQVSDSAEAAPTIDSDPNPDAWMFVYRLLLGASVIYLCALIVRALCILRATDGAPTHRIIDLYLAGVAVALVGTILCMASTIHMLELPADAAYYVTSAAVIFIAIAAGVSWWEKMTPYARLWNGTRRHRWQRIPEFLLRIHVTPPRAATAPHAPHG